MNIRSCPKCGGALAETEKNGIAYEKCSSCRGHWFDSAALDVLVQKRSPGRNLASSQEFMSLPFSEPADVRCPRCSEPMWTGTRRGIALDWCRNCKGIFLDAGEFESVEEWRRAQRSRDRRESALVTAGVVADVLWLFVLGAAGKRSPKRGRG